MNLRGNTRILAVPALLLTLSGPGRASGPAPTCAPPAPPGTGDLAFSASNCYYEVVVNNGIGFGYGAYTAATGPLHPVTEAMGRRLSAVLRTGFRLMPLFNSASVRSWDSRTDYLFDAADMFLLPEDGGFPCVLSRELPRPEIREITRADGQPVGYSSSFDVERRGDRLGVTVRVVAHGEGFEDSAVEVTTRVENRGTAEAHVGIRYAWISNILTSPLVATGTVPPEPPAEPWTTRETSWVEPSFDRMFFSWSDTPSLREPYYYEGAWRDTYYFGGASVRGPWTLDPAPTPPDRIVTSADVSGRPPDHAHAGPFNVCFEWEVPAPPRGPARSGGTEAMAMYWGDREASPLAIPPGGSAAVTVWVWAFLENPVHCEAGGPYDPVECAGARTPAPLDGSGSHTDEGNPLLHRWSSRAGGVGFDDPSAEKPTAYLPSPGTYPILHEVGIGPYTSSCETEVEEVDTTPPDLRVPAPLVLRTSDYGPDDCALPATLRAEAEDRCWGDAVRITHTTQPYLGSGGAEASYRFPRGTTQVVFRAEDPLGNVATATTEVTVMDDTPPTFTLLEAAPAVLWPPNHKMREVSVQAEAKDNCDPAPEITLRDVSSSEPADDRGDGHTEPDVSGAEAGSEDFSLLLRAERDGRGPGRTYQLVYEARDQDGNSTRGETQVLVPHDQGEAGR